MSDTVIDAILVVTPSTTIAEGFVAGPIGPSGDILAHRTIAATGTTAGLATDYHVGFTDTSSACVYQAIAMGAAANQRKPLIIQDETPASTTPYATALAHSITLKPVAGKKLNGVVDNTLVILNGGGVISVFIDEHDDMRQIGFVP